VREEVELDATLHASGGGDVGLEADAIAAGGGGCAEEAGDGGVAPIGSD